MKFNKKKKMKEFQDPYSFANAVTEGDSMTKLSMVIMGAGHFKHKQFIKGALFLLFELAFILFMVTNGFYNLSKLPGLGEAAQEGVWNEAKGIYEYSAGDN